MITSVRTMIRNWLCGTSFMRGPVQLRSDVKRGRIYLGNIPGLGVLELNGLKTDTDYSLSFHDDVDGCGFNPIINKVIAVAEPGSEQSARFYFKHDGLLYLSGKSVDYTPKVLAQELRQWFDGNMGPPKSFNLVSDAQARIFLTAYQGKSVIIKAGVQFGTEYGLEFGQKEKDLYVKVFNADRSELGLFYFRYQGRFYHTARMQDRAAKDFAPPPVKKITRWHTVRKRSKAVRDFLGGKADNPGPLIYETYEDSRVLLTTLSNGQLIYLKGLGNGVRKVKMELKENETGEIRVYVYEESGISNNYYILNQSGQIMINPSPELKWHQGKFVPEVPQIKDWLGLDREGQLKVPRKEITDFEEAIAQAPIFEDDFQAVWYAQKIRAQTGREVGLSYVIYKLWLSKKIPRQASLYSSLLASQLEMFFLMPQKYKEQVFSRYSIPELFENLWSIRQKHNFVTFVSSLFVGGSLVPRKKIVFYLHLAQAYQTAQGNEWLRQAPDFADNFAEAVCFLVKNSSGEASLRQLVLVLVVQGKLSLDKIKISTIALNYITNNLDLIEKELAENEGSFNRELILTQKGKKYYKEAEERIAYLIRELFGSDPALIEDFRRLPAVVPKERSEKDLHALARKAPFFARPFQMAEWLIEKRVADYSLAYHVNYLLYCDKITEEGAAGFYFVAGAYDWVLSNQEAVLADVKAAIDLIPKDKYPVPYLIAMEILKAQKWIRKDKDKLLVKNFIYLVVLAAFRLNWQELYPHVRKHQQGRDRVAQAGRVFVQTKVLSPEEKILLEGLKEKRFAAGRQLLTEEEINALVALSKLGYKKAQDYLIYFYLPLLKSRAQRWACAKMPFEELLQIAQIKLLAISQRFDPAFGVKFVTYVFANLDWYLFNEVSRETGAIHVPAHYIGEMKKINKIREELKQELGLYPSTEALAEVLDMDPEELRLKMKLRVSVKSMSDKVGEDTDFGEFLADPSAQVEEVVVEGGLRLILEQAIAETSNLTDQEREILTMRYLEGDIRTKKEVGVQVELTRERIRQIEAKALRKLARGRFGKKLSQYLD